MKDTTHLPADVKRFLQETESTPNLRGFEIKEAHEIGGGELKFLVAVVESGNHFKDQHILVYQNVSADWIKRWKSIRFDFGDPQPAKQPIAIFKPDNQGLAMALSFCHWMVTMNMARNLDYVRMSSRLEEEHVNLVVKVCGVKE